MAATDALARHVQALPQELYDRILAYTLTTPEFITIDRAYRLFRSYRWTEPRGSDPCNPFTAATPPSRSTILAYAIDGYGLCAQSLDRAYRTSTTSGPRAKTAFQSRSDPG